MPTNGSKYQFSYGGHLFAYRNPQEAIPIMLFTIAMGTVHSAQSAATVLSVLLKALLLTTLVVGVAALVIVAWPVISQVLIVTPLIAAYCWIFYPRTKAVK